MTDAGLWRDERAPIEESSEWDLWRMRAEKKLGFPVTDGECVDALYDMYLRDVDPEKAAEVLTKALMIAQSASAALQARHRAPVYIPPEAEAENVPIPPEGFRLDGSVLFWIILAVGALVMLGALPVLRGG